MTRKGTEQENIEAADEIENSGYWWLCRAKGTYRRDGQTLVRLGRCLISTILVSFSGKRYLKLSAVEETRRQICGCRGR